MLEAGHNLLFQVHTWCGGHVKRGVGAPDEAGGGAMLAIGGFGITLQGAMLVASAWGPMDVGGVRGEAGAEAGVGGAAAAAAVAAACALALATCVRMRVGECAAMTLHRY